MGRSRKILITCFVLFNFLCMVRVFIPLGARFFQTVYRPVDAYLSFFSLYQDWMMFAPNPNRLNHFISAKVEFLDGSAENFVFPRTEQLSLKEKYVFGEKYRKLMSEGIRKDSNSFMWRDTAKFVLRKIKNNNYTKIPIKVHLFRNWDEIPEISQSFRKHDQFGKLYKSHKFFTFEVI